MTSANLLRPVTVADLMATGLRSQQAVPLRSEDCAGCHDSGSRIGKRQPGVPTGIPGVTAPREYRQLAECGEYSRHQVLAPARLYRSDHWTSVHRSDHTSDALRLPIQYLWRLCRHGDGVSASQFLNTP
jgi:hypothetical protein